MTVNDYCAGRIISSVSLERVDGKGAVKITFVGTDHYALLLPVVANESVMIQLHDGKETE